MENKKDLPEKSKGNSPIGRQAAYSKAASHFQRALDVIAEALESRSPNVRFGAARLVYETVLPPKVVAEIAGKDGGDLVIKIISYLDKKEDGADTST